MELGVFSKRCEFCNCTAGGGHVMSGKWLNEPRTSLKVKLPFENLPLVRLDCLESGTIGWLVLSQLKFDLVWHETSLICESSAT